MNELIERILTGFTVDGVQIPVKFLHYEGHGEPYIVYSGMDDNDSLTADDELQAYITYYDFDVFSTGNYNRILSALRNVLEANGFVWQVSRSSPDMYEEDTGYYHRTVNYAIFKEDE